jgi:hypothetical protein
MVYLRAAVDAPDAYVQLIGWTARSKWDSGRPVLEAILASANILPKDGPG